MDSLIAQFQKLNINERPVENKPETWFWYKGKPIKSYEDFIQMVNEEMRLTYHID